MKKLLLIYNPHAGKGKVCDKLAEILGQLTQAGWLVTVRPTFAPGDAVTAAAELAPQFERVVCCGGDGTLNEVMSGLSQLDEPPVLGYIPTGTTNDFSRNLALPKGLVPAAATAAAGYPFACDTGRFNDQVFVYVAAFGAFTDVSYHTPQQFKNMFGHLAYLLQGVAVLPDLKTYHLRVAHDGGSIEDDFLYGMVSNTVSVGGFPILAADQVRLDDGLFEVVLIRAPKTPAELQGLIRVLTTQKIEEGNGAVLAFRAREATFTCSTPLPWTLDGEYGGSPRQVHIKNQHQAVRIVRGRP